MRGIYFTISSIFILGLSQGMAQVPLLASHEYPEHRLYPLNGEIYINQYARIKGNPYHSADWLLGTITLENGKVIPDVKIKFDTYSHSILVYNDYLSRIVKPEPTTIKAFHIITLCGECKFMRVEPGFGTMHGRDYAFVHVLSNGNYLLVKYHYNITKQISSAGLYTDEFDPGIRYYCKVNNQFQRTRLRKSFFRKNFPERYLDIKSYISVNKINIKKETGFTRVMDYLNSEQAEY